MRSLPIRGPGLHRPAGLLLHDLDRRARHFLVARGVRLVNPDIQFLVLNRQCSGLLVIGEVAFRTGDGHLPVLADAQADLVHTGVARRRAVLRDRIGLARLKRRPEVMLRPVRGPARHGLAVRIVHRDLCALHFRSGRQVCLGCLQRQGVLEFRRFLSVFAVDHLCLQFSGSVVRDADLRVPDMLIRHDASDCGCILRDLIMILTRLVIRQGLERDDTLSVIRRRLQRLQVLLVRGIRQRKRERLVRRHRAVQRLPGREGRLHRSRLVLIDEIQLVCVRFLPVLILHVRFCRQLAGLVIRHCDRHRVYGLVVCDAVRGPGLLGHRVLVGSLLLKG